MKSIALFLAITISLTTVPPTFARGGGFGGGGFGGGRSFGGGGFGGGGRSFGGGDFGGGGRSFGGDSGFRGGDGGFRGGDNGFRGGDSGFRGGDDGFRNGNFGGGFGDIAQSRGGDFNRGNFANRPNSGNFSNNHPNASGDFSNWKNGQGNFHNFDPSNADWHNNSIRNSGNTFTQNNYNHYNAFGAYGGYGHPYGYGGFWGYPGAWGAYGWGAATAWTCMGLTTLTSFLGIAALAGSGKNNGNNGSSVSNVTYEGPNVYVNGNPAGTQVDYYNQAEQLASAGQQYVDTTPNTGSSGGGNSQWQPLGVFSLAQKGQTQSSMLFQLAINKDGIVRGNYMNQLTNETDQVYGSLDKKTQRISFTIGQNTANSTVFDTSLSDITKDDAPVLVHYGPNSTQAMMLVRLPAPQNGATS